MFTIAALIGFSLLRPSPVRSLAAAPIDSAEMTVVVVQNDRAVPVKVVLEHGAVDVTLGVIPAGSDSALRVPDRFDGDDVRIFVEAPGSLDQSTDLLNIERGEKLAVVVPKL